MNPPNRPVAAINEYCESLTCAWCERDGPGVVISFASGFLQNSPVCFKCMRQALVVNHRQNGSAPLPVGSADRQPA